MFVFEYHEKVNTVHKFINNKQTNSAARKKIVVFKFVNLSDELISLYFQGDSKN